RRAWRHLLGRESKAAHRRAADYCRRILAASGPRSSPAYESRHCDRHLARRRDYVGPHSEARITARCSGQRLRAAAERVIVSRACSASPHNRRCGILMFMGKAIDVNQLSRDERLELIEQLWDSLSDQERDSLRLTAEQDAELDRRLDALEKD